MIKRIKKKSIIVHKVLRVCAITLCLVVVSLLSYLCFGPLPVYDHGVNSIEELVAHAKTIDEFIPLDNNSYDHPCFDSFYKKNLHRDFYSVLVGA